jgi:methyl-accepting chemotaxis protein
MSNSTLEKTDLTASRVPTPGRTGMVPSSTAVPKELRSCLSVLPVLAGQLQEVASHVEDSVVKVCSSFQDMVERAREASTQVPMIHAHSGHGADKGGIGIEELISNTRETMGHLLNRIEETSTVSKLTVDRMEKIEQEIMGLSDTIQDIDNVASKARVLALNGQLEAARFGEQGAAFAVVATETSNMAIHAVESSKMMRKMTTSISKSIGSASLDLHERASSYTKEAALSHEEVNHSLDSMAVLHDEMQQTIAQSKSNSEKLSRDISQAIMAMQFQDAVNQRIGHVIHTLQEIYSAVQSYIDHDSSGKSPNQTQEALAKDWNNHMASRYTMASEHKVLASQTATQTGGANDLGNNVELF